MDKALSKFMMSFFFFFYWNIIALQCCSVNQCESVIIMCVCVCVCIPSLLSVLSPFHPSGSSQSTWLNSRYYTAASQQFSILRMMLYICQCYFLNLSQPVISLARVQPGLYLFFFLFYHNKIVFKCTSKCSDIYRYVDTDFYELPWWLSSKEADCQCRRHGFDPWVGKIPRRGKWQPTPVFLPGKSHGQEPGGLQSMGLQKSWTQLSN